MTKPNVTVIQPTILESNEKIRSAAYCRVSSDSTDQLNSYMAQIRYYENFLADSETETLIAVYADEGVSGTRADKREEFQRLMKDCRKGKIDRIYAKSISRFARNTRDCLIAVRELSELGITIFFEKENIDTANISDEMMVTIMGALAQEESSSISNNLQWSIQKKMQNGTFKPASLPYGYKRANGEITIITAESEVVKHIYDDFLGGIGMERIALNLNEENRLKGQKSTKWCKNTVRYILTNEKYMGDAVFQKYYTKSQFPFKQSVNNGERSKYLVPDIIPPIISKSDFYKVQEIIASRGHLKNKTKGEIYPLSSKISCGICGKSFRRKIINNKEYWTCITHNLKASDCIMKAIAQQKIYDVFIRLYNKLKHNYNALFPPLLNQLHELKNKKFSGNANFIELSREVAKLKEQNYVLTRLKTKGFLDESKYFEQTNEINGKLNKLSKELQKITRCDDDDDVINKIQEIADFIENGIDLMSEFDEVMFESLVEKIVVNSQTKFEFHLHGGLKFRVNI